MVRFRLQKTCRIWLPYLYLHKVQPESYRAKTWVDGCSFAKLGFYYFKSIGVLPGFWYNPAETSENSVFLGDSTKGPTWKDFVCYSVFDKPEPITTADNKNPKTAPCELRLSTVNVHVGRGQHSCPTFFFFFFFWTETIMFAGYLYHTFHFSY